MYFILDLNPNYEEVRYEYETTSTIKIKNKNDLLPCMEFEEKISYKNAFTAKYRIIPERIFNDVVNYR